MTTLTNRPNGILAIAPTPVAFVGLTHPDYPEYLKALVRAIAQATKKGSKRLYLAAISVAKWIKLKADEGAEMHNRHMRLVDERYASNWYHIRSMM